MPTTESDAPRFTEADYPKLTELLTMKHTLTLDCERASSSESVDEDEIDEEEGFVYLNFAGNEEFYGNVTSSYLDSLYDYSDEKLRQKVLGKRFRTFVQDDGEIGLEISFLPGPPFDGSGFDQHAKAIWDNTRLHEVMTFDEFLQDVSDGAEWVYRCFGKGGEMYAVTVEVTKPGRSPLVEIDDLLPKPLWIQRKGAKYNVHIGCWED